MIILAQGPKFGQHSVDVAVELHALDVLLQMAVTDHLAQVPEANAGRASLGVVSESADFLSGRASPAFLQEQQPP